MYVIRERADDGQNTSLCSLDRPLPTTALHKPILTQHLPISPPKTTSYYGPNYGVICTVARVSLAGGPNQKPTQSQTVCSGTWRPPVLTIALPGTHVSLPGRTFPLLRNLWDQLCLLQN